MENVRLPESWQDWIIEEEIGRGSYGTVYKAVNRIQQSICAIKIIRIPSDDGEREALRREYQDEQSVKNYYSDLVRELTREIQTLDDLKGCQNVVELEDFVLEEHEDQIGWTIYIRMEYLQSFPVYCASRKMTENEVIQVGVDICSALEQCEKLNIIHRDIKPDNILVAADGTCKLCDFGIARHIDRSKSVLSVKGTYTYMAPEIYHGNKYGKSVDIYSLGILLYRLMNRNRDAFINPGKQMVYYRDREEALKRRMGGEILPVPADATPEFAQIIRKACAYSEKDRYESPSAMKRDLQLLLKGEYHMTEEAEPDRKSAITPDDLPETQIESPKEEKRKKTGKKHFSMAVCLCLVFCLMAATGVAWYFVQTQQETGVSNGEFPATVTELADVGNEEKESENYQFLSAMKEVDEILWRCAAEDDYEMFRALYSDVYSEEDIDAFYSWVKEYYYKEGMDQTCSLFICGEGDICLGEMVRYRVAESYPGDRVESASLAYVLRREDDGKWYLCEDDLLNENALLCFPEGYREAVKAERNHVLLDSFMWMDSSAVYEGVMKVTADCAWQNEDGSVDVLISARNGTDKELYVSELNLTVEDRRRGFVVDGIMGSKTEKHGIILADGSEMTVSPGRNRNYIIHIEAEAVQTGTEVWEDIHYSLFHSNDYTETTESGSDKG